EAIAQQAGVQTSELEMALADVERVVVNDMETGGLRPVLSEAAKHSIVIGNFLLYDPDEGPVKLYPLTSYVVDRDGLGNVLE
ncbi:portal protein, partial [Salmonella enterica subsp. enterica serovar Oranienburg]